MKKVIKLVPHRSILNRELRKLETLGSLDELYKNIERLRKDDGSFRVFNYVREYTAEMTRVFHSLNSIYSYEKMIRNMKRYNAVYDSIEAQRRNMNARIREAKYQAFIEDNAVQS